MNSLPGDDKKKKRDDQDGKVDLVGVSGLSKERLSKPAQEEGRGSQEVTPMTEYTKKVDLEPEVESWLEKLEKEDTQLQDPVVDDQGKVVLDSAKDGQGSGGKFKVILPLTKEEVDRGLHLKVINSARWLAEWCIKTIKMFHGKVAYKKGK
jgi:hypothetical protein